MKLIALLTISLLLASPAFAQGAINASVYKDGKLLATKSPQQDETTCPQDAATACKTSTVIDGQPATPKTLDAFPTAVNDHITD